MRTLGHGQVWWAELDKVRPVVILTRSTIANRLSRVLVVPVTTQQRGLETEVELGPDEGVQSRSFANLDATELLPVTQLIAMAGQVDLRRWDEFCSAMAWTMACPNW